jgi:hypothetical protein
LWHTAAFITRQLQLSWLQVLRLRARNLVQKCTSRSQKQRQMILADALFEKLEAFENRAYS